MFELSLIILDGKTTWAGRYSEEFGGQAGHTAALAGLQRHVAEARLPGERAGEHREGVIRFAEVWRVDLTRVAGEHDFGALAHSGQDRS